MNGLSCIAGVHLQSDGSEAVTEGFLQLVIEHACVKKPFCMLQAGKRSQHYNDL